MWFLKMDLKIPCLSVFSKVFSLFSLTKHIADLGLQIFGSWLGAYSTDIGIWYDSKGNLVTYTRWGPYQPMYNGSCASIGSDGYWFADHCESKEEFICRIKPESNVTTTTSRPTLPLLTTKATNAPAQPTIDPNPVNCPGYDRKNCLDQRMK